MVQMFLQNLTESQNFWFFNQLNIAPNLFVLLPTKP